MNKPGTPTCKDAELVAPAEAFAKAFSDSAAAQTPPAIFASGSSISLRTASVLETDDVAETMAVLRARAMQILDSKTSHERAMDQTLFNAAHHFVMEGRASRRMPLALRSAGELWHHWGQGRPH